MARKTQKSMKLLKQNVSGGSAAGGGMNFQACVIAIAVVHIARGTPLGWLTGIAVDIPVSLAAESGGPGDDIRLVFKDGSVTEVQVKKGLSAGNQLWDSLLSLASAIDLNAISYGVLAVSPDSSRTICYDLARDLKRIGDGRHDNLKPLSQQLKKRLEDRSLNVERVCAKLRIITVHGLDMDSAGVTAAKAEIGHLCANVQGAWDHIYLDSHSLIERRGGRRSAESVLLLLRSAGIVLHTYTSNSPLILLQKLSTWVVEANASFSVFGINKPLPLESAWLEMKALVQEEGLKADNNLDEALKRYHSWNARSIPRNAKQVDAVTLGQFVRRGVVIAGPGMGKTTLLKRLSRSYAKNGHPVLHVRLPAIAAQMKSTGRGFESSVLELGLDGSGIIAEDLRRASLENMVLLCDGLDECGHNQANVAQGLLSFAAGHPHCRIIVTTRPIGYDSSLLRSWRHYELLPLDASTAKQEVSKLLSGVLDEESPEFTKALTFAKAQLKLSHVNTVVTKSPMLLGFLVALSLKGVSVGTTRTQLYHQLFKLIEDAPTPRHADGEESSAVMVRFLEILGWHLLVNPHDTLKQILERCAINIAQELGLPALKAQDVCHRCARRWQDLGMLERVRFQADEAITFVHKTFGEYAAARQLAVLDPEAQNNALKSYSNQASWTETIKFSCSMGLAENVIAEMLAPITKDELSANAVKRAVEFLNEVDTQFSSTVIEKLIDHAWDCVLSPRCWIALQAGSSLSCIASRYPEEVCNRASGALAHSQPWTKLVAWACVTVAGSQYYDFQAMLDMLKIVPSADYRFNRSLSVGFLINNPRTKLVESFIISATRAILAHHPDQNGLAVLDEILLQDIGQTVGFISEMSTLLTPYGKRLSKDYSLDWTTPWLTPDWRKNYRDQYISLLDALDDPSTIVSIEAQIDDDSVLMHLSGFMDASGHWEVSASDVWRWNSGDDADPVKEVLHAVAAISGVERDRLTSEVRTLAASLKSDPDDYVSFYDRIAHVDTDPDWESAKQLPLSLDKLETAILHRSSWIVLLATNLLEKKASKEDISPILERLLEKGTGTTLSAAAYLTSFFDSLDASAMLRKRLLDPICKGCDSLFEKLGELDVALDGEETHQCIKNGLLGMNPNVAIAAAELINRVATPGATNVIALLWEAYRHWQVHEEPYPVSGGIVPESPRALLVKAMLLAQAAVDDAELMTMAADSRPDVHEASKDPLFERLTQSETFRDQFLHSISNGKLKLGLLSEVLKNKTYFSAYQCVAIRGTLEHEDAAIRYAAIPILAEPYSTDDEIEQYARRMMLDPEAEIREMAHELLRQNLVP